MPSAITSPRRKLSTRMLLIAAGLLVGMAALRLHDPALLVDARHAVFDTYQRLHPRPYQPAPVRVVDLDEAALAAFGQWPWPRDLLAELVGRLHAAGSAAIAFDMVFAEPDRTSPHRYLEQALPADVRASLRDSLEALPDHDAQFADAIAKAPVVLGVAGSQAATTTRPRRLAGLAHAGSNPAAWIDRLPGVVGNLAELEAAATGQGSVALSNGHDGIVRSIPLVQAIEDEVFPTLTSEALRVAQGASTIVTRSSDASGEVKVGDVTGLESLRIGALEVPVTATGRMLLHDSGPVPERSLSAATVLREPVETWAEDIAGHIVLIGTSAAGLKDIHATPMAPYAAGVSIHAQALEQMILGWHLQRPDWAKGGEVVLLLATGILLVVLLSRIGAIGSAVAGAAVFAVTLGISWYAFAEHRLLLDPIYPGFAALVIYLAVSFYGYLQTEREKRHVRQAFSAYLAPPLVEQLVDNPDALRLRGEARDMTFLFTDIAGFTSFTEKSEPEHLVRLLNEYLDTMCGLIMEHGGTIDKIVGDAVHAIFNAPLDQPGHAAQAVSCALALDRAARTFVDKYSTPALAFGETRIGINTGSAIVGNFGGEKRFDYTAHGDAINTAARLESVNKHLGTSICVAASTASRCPDQAFLPIASLVLKGKTVAIDAFLPISAEQADSEYAFAYTVAYDSLYAGVPAAAEKMAALHERFPSEPLAALHARRLAKGEKGTEIWLTEK
jgi:adenylate cyclase